MRSLANCCILVVEDEFLIATALCEMLEDASAVVLGPATSVREAINLIQNYQVDGAIVDMNLNGQWSDPIAEELNSRRIPFVITTGYGASERTERFGARIVAKPYSWEEVEDKLGQAMIESATKNPGAMPT
jgi:response regulator RpfG family c-di-GMP phosphodiesterase